MADRATNGGGVAVSVLPYLSTPGTNTGNGADWFGPGNPLRPVAPPEVKGRSWDVQPARNMQQRPRSYEQIKFPTLRTLAKSYDVLRLVIESRKAQVCALEWDVGARDGETKLTPEQETRAKAIRKFFEKPQPRRSWTQWLGKLLEDLFVIDAPTIYPRKTRGGGLYELRIFDGATINLMVDDWGETPDPPLTAYQQILHGLAAVDYTADELIYKPRVLRPGEVFGFSPVEQVYVIVNIALRRETWQLNFFTEGTQPDALIGTPSEWTPDQVRAFQNWWDSVQLSPAGGKRGVRFVPGEVAKGYVPTKDSELFGAAEEWIARVISYAFNVSPQWATKMMNRATGETQKEIATEEGLLPIKLWLQELINDIIETQFASPDLGLHWKEEEEIDQQTLSGMVTEQATKGLISIDEGRHKLGHDPLGGDFAKPMVLITTGYAPIDFEDQLAQTKAKQDLMPDPMGGGFGDGGDKGSGGSSGGKSGGDGSAGLGSGRGGGGGSGADKAADPPPRSLLVKRAQIARRLLSAERAAGRRCQSAIATAARKALTKTADDVAGQVGRMLRGQARKVAKSDPLDPTGAIASAAEDAALASLTADEIVAALDLDSLTGMIDVVEDALFDLASDTMFKALAQVGVKKSDELVNQVNQRALDFARDRAAELVGKRWTADGELIDNPNPDYAITETTRDMLRKVIADGLEGNIGTPAIADSIQDAFAFSSERADLIARTETSRANEQGKLDGWREAETKGITVRKTWLTVGDDDVDTEICEPNEAEGPIALDDDFGSGDDAPPGHPNCRCVLVPEVVETGAGDNGGNDDE